MMRRLLPLLFLTAAAADSLPAGPLPYGPLPLPPQKEISAVADRTVTLTIDALSHSSDVPTRVRFIGDLGFSAGAAARAELVKLLADPEPFIRAQAVRSLAGGVEIAPLSKDPSPLVRLEVVIASPTEAVILQALDDPDENVRNCALNKSVSEITDAALARKLSTLPPPAQAIACRTLSQRKALAATTAIEPLLSSAALLSRIAAIQSLAAMHKITAAELIPQRAHEHPAVRTAAVAALAAIDPAQRIAPATAALNDPDVEVRVAGANILADVGTAAAVRPLFDEFKLAEDGLTTATRAALAAIAARDAAARSEIDTSAAALLSSDVTGLRCDGSYLLGALASKTELPRHIALLNDADWLLVQTVAVALGKIADPSACPPLANAARRAAGIGESDINELNAKATDDERLQRYSAGEQAVLACVAIRYPAVIEAVGPIITSQEGPLQMRVAAVWAIGMLESPAQAAPTLRTLLGRTKDIKESQIAIIEAVKAAGNAKVADLENDLVAARDGGLGWEMTGTAILALDRIKGTTTPLEPPEVVSAPNTAIRDITPAAR